MKNFDFRILILGVFILLIMSLTSCSQELADLATPTVDEDAIETCDLAYITIHDNNVRFHKTAEVDTMIMHWEHPTLGWKRVTWVDGKIDWECIGFPRRCESYEFTIEANGQFCRFTIPGGVGCNNSNH